MKCLAYIAMASGIAVCIGFASSCSGAVWIADPEFGDSGVAITYIGSEGLEVWSVCLQSDGKVIIGGSHADTLKVARYSTTGNLDSSFATDGILTGPVTSSAMGDVAVQSDDKILVVGSGSQGFWTARYTPDGRPDSTWDGDGVATRTICSQAHTATGVIQQSDGKVVLTGGLLDGVWTAEHRVLMRYNTDGSVDSTFGGVDGYVSFALGNTQTGSRAHDLVEDSSGALITAGITTHSVIWTEHYLSVTRNYTDGGRDLCFADPAPGPPPDTCNAGNALVGDTGMSCCALAIDLDACGRIVSTGWSSGGQGQIVVRHTSGGFLDTTFAGDGVVLTGWASDGQDIIALDDSKILIAGGDSLTVTRYNEDGSIDFTFGGTGYIAAPTSALAKSALVMEDGCILVGGQSTTEFALTRYLPRKQWLDVTDGIQMGYAGQSHAGAWGDYDDDGDEDLYIANADGNNYLMRNDGPAGFTDVTTGHLNTPTSSQGSVWGDYDNDGLLDLFIATYLDSNRLLQNQGGGVFRNTASPPMADPGAHGTSPSWVDYDNDGLLDIHIPNYGQQGRLFHNEGAGAFSNASSPPINQVSLCHGAAWADYDNDGDLDLYLANIGHNSMLRNDGSGTFSDVTAGALVDSGFTTGVSFGDYDNDGDLDLYIVNLATANRLLKNDGSGDFTDVTALSGAAGILDSCIWAGWTDVDNDADLDLFVTTKYRRNSLLLNDGAGYFDETDPEILGDTPDNTNVAWADFDQDGLVDLYCASLVGENYLFKNNNTLGNHWLHVKLVGTLSNRSAIGARVRAVTGSLSQIREVSGGSGRRCHDSLPVEFGLGGATVVDTLEIRWPRESGIPLTGGTVEILLNVPVDTLLVVVEDDFSGLDRTSDKAPAIAGLRCRPNPFGLETRISFRLARIAEVNVSVYTVSGRHVVTLIDGVLAAGQHQTTWDGLCGEGTKVASGVYFCRVRTGAAEEVQRIVHLR